MMDFFTFLAIEIAKYESLLESSHEEIFKPNNSYIDEVAMAWWNLLTAEQQQYAKDSFVEIFGVEFQQLIPLFSENELISIFYQKFNMKENYE